MNFDFTAILNRILEWVRTHVLDKIGIELF